MDLYDTHLKSINLHIVPNICKSSKSVIYVELLVLKVRRVVYYLFNRLTKEGM